MLIPYFEVNGTNSYPDDFNLFSDMVKVRLESDDYWLCRYLGSRPLETGSHKLADWLAFVASQARIRKIKVNAFYERLDEKLPALMSKAEIDSSEGNFELKALLLRIEKSDFVDLDDARLKDCLQRSGLFTEEEQNALFEDGQKDEEFKFI